MANPPVEGETVTSVCPLQEPLQVSGCAEVTRVNVGGTVIRIESVPEQPLASITSTVNVVVTEAVCVCEAPESDPGFQVKVDPTVDIAFSVKLFPRQTVSSIPASTKAAGLTVTEDIAVLVHPLASVPVTVKLLLVEGITVTTAALDGVVPEDQA